MTARRGSPTPSPAPNPVVSAASESDEPDIGTLFGSLVVVAVIVTGEPDISVVNVTVCRAVAEGVSPPAIMLAMGAML